MAQRAGLCLAFEPDPVAYETLSRNHELNADAPWISRLKIFNAAIHSSGAPIQIAGAGGDSMTSALTVIARNSWTVRHPLRQMPQRLPLPNNLHHLDGRDLLRVNYSGELGWEYQRGLIALIFATAEPLGLKPVGTM